MEIDILYFEIFLRKILILYLELYKIKEVYIYFLGLFSKMEITAIIININNGISKYKSFKVNLI